MLHFAKNTVFCLNSRLASSIIMQNRFHIYFSIELKTAYVDKKINVTKTMSYNLGSSSTSSRKVQLQKSEEKRTALVAGM